MSLNPQNTLKHYQILGFLSSPLSPSILSSSSSSSSLCLLSVDLHSIGMMEENVKSELRDCFGRLQEPETRALELRFESSNGGNGFSFGSDNASRSEDLQRNDFYTKSDYRSLSSAGSNSARYKSMSPAMLPISRSPCLTIPPGLSPTTLLDSPVLLSNMKAEPSPTTGTFLNSQIMRDSILSDTISSLRNTSNSNTCDERSFGNFEFKPHIRSSSGSGVSSLGPSATAGSNHQQSEPFVQVQGQCQSPTFASSPSDKNEHTEGSSRELTLSVTTPNLPIYMVASKGGVPVEVASVELWQRQDLECGVQAKESDDKGTSPVIAAERSSEDGYNWRKYGQKHVKGCEFPRSYYKCTHPNCQVKKQLERSHDGQITEIVYKGQHDHPKPQPSRRMSVGTVLSAQEERSDRLSTLNNREEKTSMNNLASHYIEPNGTPVLSPVTESDDNVENTQLNRITDELEEEDDPDSKRRKKDIVAVDVPISKVTREPRVVVQTQSEVDILDDGYRWRKYGQKVVKGNPNPRSYYKCTNAGCPVRKHVERASHDPKAVITTYEGKHNHDVPAAKASSAYEPTEPTIYNSAAPNGMLRIRGEESDTISLDLGVGMSSSPDNRSNEKQQTLHGAPAQNQSYISHPGHPKVIQEAQFSARYGSLNDGAGRYGSREDQSKSFSFETPPLNHSSNQYQQNMGRLIMGP